MKQKQVIHMGCVLRALQVSEVRFSDICETEPPKCFYSYTGTQVLSLTYPKFKSSKKDISVSHTMQSYLLSSHFSAYELAQSSPFPL